MKRKIGSMIVAAGVSAIVVGCNTGKEQAQNPQIIRQPADQLLKVGSVADLTVAVANGSARYQWLLNGLAMAGQNDSTLRFASIEVKDAGYYSCEVSQGANKIETREANVEVYTTSIDPRSGLDPITVYALPETHAATQGACPGSYAGLVNYVPVGTNGWGWMPDTNDYTTFTAADGTTATNTKIVYLGMNGDGNCGQASVTIPNPPQSTNYQFTIFFPKKVPTTNYPIVLTGFYP